METNIKIEKIINVFDGEFKPGIIPRKNVGRYSDCFVCYLYGKAEYRFGDYSFTASPQKFIYLAKDSVYEICVTEKSRFIWIDLDFCVSPYPRKSQAFKCNASSMKNQFEKMLRVWNDKSPYCLSQLFSYAYNVCAEAVRSENEEYSKSDSLISDITAYVLSRYSDPDFTVSELASRFGISEVQLRRLFKRLLCVSPIKYVSSLKAEKAKNMLRFSNYSIAEVAQSVGFEDPYYFSRFFKKETGASPSEYRASASSKL